MPDVRGMTYEKAEEELRKHDLKIKRASEDEPSNEYEKGQVKSQTPGEGEKVKKNSTVTVVISSGEEAEKVAVPDVEGKSESEAERLIQAAGLKVIHDTENSDTVAEGYVISSDPVAGTEVDEGTSVTIIVSLGKEQVKVPDLRNKTAAEAEAALAAVGLVGSASEDYSDSVAAGNVISQDPGNGTTVEKGSTVSYVVSLGGRTQTVDVPDILRSYPDTAEQLLSEAGLTAAYGGEQYSDYPAGTVCRVSPEVGVKVEKGTTIYYWVSLGSEPSGGGDQNGSEQE